jgi:hypothetical protein
MYSVAVIVDNRNHEFIFNFLKGKCRQINVVSVPIETFYGDNASTSFSNRLTIARRIRRWVSEDDQYHSILIFSDYSFVYRTLVHFCRLLRKPVFLYQDGFIFFEPWPKNLSGILKRIVYGVFWLFGYSHLISYTSFHSKPDLIFSWGDFFSLRFRGISNSKVLTLGSALYAKDFAVDPAEASARNTFLYFGTYYRDFIKDKVIKTEAVAHLKSLLQNDEGLICHIKLHPLDKNIPYLEDLLQKNSLRNKVHFLENKFLLHENMARYRFIISELSSETIFASLFSQNIYFIMQDAAKKHFKLLDRFLTKQNIAGKEFYKIDQNQISRFQAEYFQRFNVELFEQTVQTYR